MYLKTVQSSRYISLLHTNLTMIKVIVLLGVLVSALAYPREIQQDEEGNASYNFLNCDDQ